MQANNTGAQTAHVGARSCGPRLLSSKGRTIANTVSEDQQEYKPLVLSVGKLHDLLSLREAILRSAGYQVITCTEYEETIAVIRNGRCGVMLLCYSVPDKWRRSLIRDFRDFCRQGRIIGITNHPVVQPSREMDELVYGIEGPEMLIQAVNRESSA